MKFRGDVGCKMPCGHCVVGYFFLAEFQLWPLCPPGAVLDPGPSLRGPGLSRGTGFGVGETGGQPGSCAGAVLLKAFPFAFEGFPGQKCSSDLCN